MEVKLTLNSNGSRTMTKKAEAETPHAGPLEYQTPPAGDQEPRSASEKYLASLWAEIIGLERVTLADRFLEVGGNSLTLNIILNRVEAEKGVSLNPELFLDEDGASLFELAGILDEPLEHGPPQTAKRSTGCA